MSSVSAFGPDQIPDQLAGAVRGRTGALGVTGDAWLQSLPRRVASMLTDWDLTVDGAPRPRRCALAVPVRRDDGTPATLKVTWPHPRARHEHLALRAWAGRGAVRLLAADPWRWGLLLERAVAEDDLTGEPLARACAHIGTLLRILSVPAIRRLDPLSTWTAHFLDRPTPPAVPRRFVDQARALARDFLADGGVDDRLVHTDLHFGNVGQAVGHERPWRALEATPMAADPAYAVWPTLWHRWPEALTGGDPSWHVQSRLGWVCESAGIDERRARAWGVIRSVAAAAAFDRPIDRARRTRQVALLKALQPR